ncbi:MAG: HAMP domain-containing sensor histidine kinase [Myxococcota bacterium]|nr:HAMP domain-containing sensor histidine kinase [Myxococcota bacterium]
MTRRSIGFPLVLLAVLLLVVVLLGVGWQLLVLNRGIEEVDWVLVVAGAGGSLSIGVGLVWLSAWLVREIGANQRQRAFLDAVTHEMKTPLASMRLYLDTLDRHDPEPARRREFLGNMRGDLERLDRTVEQVLAAARAEDRRTRAQLEPVPLLDLLRRCIAEIRETHQLPDRAVALESQEEARVRGSAGELMVVFRNLLENAVKYSEAPVEVRVLVRGAVDGRVAVEICDSGVGIPSDELRKIFQRFYRAGRDVQRKASGLGLGLFIVRNLVRRQGGRVVARSDGFGHGSRFVVTLRAC